MNEPEAVVWMSRLAQRSTGDGALPDPALIWWQSRLLERRRAQSRAVRPTAIAQWISLVVALVAAIILCTLNWTGIRGLLGPFGLGLYAAAGGIVAIGMAALRRVARD